ncbi:MAG: Rpp14/Pop5 family protein [Candidatus Nanohaloarchaea archaeon]
MKRLPPAIKEKERYLKFRVRTDGDPGFGDVVDAIWDSALDYLGSKNVSEADFWIVKNRFDSENMTGVLKVNRDSEQDMRAALALVDTVGGDKGSISVEKTSGSIKKLD